MPFILKIENSASKFTIMSFWALALKPPAENGIPKKSLETSLTYSQGTNGEIKKE